MFIDDTYSQKNNLNISHYEKLKFQKNCNIEHSKTNNNQIKYGFNKKVSLFLLYFLILLNIFIFFDKKKDSEKIGAYYKLCNRGKLINKKNFKRVENPKVSIVSPVHNREKYILRLIRSVQNQFFDDIEIILVDDFSTDRSVELIEKYQKDDERILLMKHKKNKGTLISRNNGVLKAKGEYIILPDPDDLLSKNILNNCYNLAKQYNYDIIRYNIYLDNNDIFFKDIVNQLENRPIYKPELSSYLFYGSGTLKQIDFNVANKFIKRDTYIRAIKSMNDFYLNQYMTNHEDGLINFVLYRTANSFYFLKKIGYYYIPNNQSITLNYQNNYDETIRFIFINLKFVFENTNNNKKEKDIINCLFQRLFEGVLSERLNLITKDHQFFIDIINMYLNCIFISKDNILKLNKLKSIIETLIKSKRKNFYKTIL
jgi:glycosyltransferase involved in cell wall biosynthesis